MGLSLEQLRFLKMRRGKSQSLKIIKEWYMQKNNLLTQKAMLDLHQVGWRVEEIASLFGLNKQQVEDKITSIYQEAIQQGKIDELNIDLTSLVDIHNNTNEVFDGLSYRETDPSCNNDCGCSLGYLDDLG